MPKTKKPVKAPTSAAGTYVYDRKLKRLVQVSSDIPGVSAKGRKSEPMGGCGGGPCGRGACSR